MRNLAVTFGVSLVVAVMCHGQPTQGKFVIAAYWDPAMKGPGNEAADKALVQKMRDANFNIFLNTNVYTAVGHIWNEDYKKYSPPNGNGVRYKIARVAEVEGMQIVVSDIRFDSPVNNTDSVGVFKDYTSNLSTQTQKDAIRGYNLRDEPHAGSELVIVNNWAKAIKAQDSKRFAWANLLPYSDSFKVPLPDWWANYKNYVLSYMNSGGTKVASFDYYPFLHPSGWWDYNMGGTRYFKNLQLFADEAGARGMTWFATALTVKHAFYKAPTANELRFMVYAPLTYGAKGIVYFTYATPLQADVLYQSALLDANNNPTMAYTWAQSINKDLERMGADLVNLKWLETIHGATPDANGESVVIGGANQPQLLNISAQPEIAVGKFDGSGLLTGGKYLMVFNKSRSNLHSFSLSVSGTWRVSTHANAKAQWNVDNAAIRSGGNTSFSVFLNPAEAKLFRLDDQNSAPKFGLYNYQSSAFVTGTGRPAQADYDGDGWADIAFKQSDGTFKFDYAGDGFGSWNSTKLFSQCNSNSTYPAPADYDGDGKADIACKQWSNGTWYVWYSSKNNVASVSQPGYGGSDWLPLPGDYDGDGKIDLAAKSEGGRWVIDLMGNGYRGTGPWDYDLAGYGDVSAIPVPADYDGDGKMDLSVKTADGRWLIDYKANGYGIWDISLAGYGEADAWPAPADYDGDKKADLCVKTDDGRLLIDLAYNGFVTWDIILPDFGLADVKPFPADFDGDGRADFATRSGVGVWSIDQASR